MAILEIAAGALLLKELAGSLNTDPKQGTPPGGLGGGTPPAPPTDKVASMSRTGGGFDQQLVNTGIGLGATLASTLAIKGATTALTALGASTAVSGPLIAGAVLWTAAGAATGYLIAGDPGGAIVGGIFGLLQGSIINIGRRLMQEIWLLLGGTAGSVGSWVVQGAGLVGGLLVAAYGTTAIPFVALCLFIIAGIASAVDDGSRVAYGQSGAVADMKLLATSYFWSVRDGIRNAAMAGLNTASADGQALQWNNLSPQAKQGFELLVSSYCGCQVNGFVAEDNAWRLRVFVHNDPFSRGQAWAALRGVFIENNRWPEVVDHINALISLGNSSGAPPMGPNLPTLSAAGYAGVLGMPVDHVAAWKNMGRTLCNARNYFAAMNAPWGIGATGFQHAQYQRDQLGQFQGMLNPATGDLLDGFGNACRWQLSAAMNPPRPVFEAGAPTVGL